jgi:hypothetical protein
VSAPSTATVTARALSAVTTLLVVAVGARLIWELLHPLVGPLLVLVILLAIVAMVVRRRRW